MTAKSVEKSPSILGVYFYATLMALLGAVLGFLYMTTFKPQAFASEAEYQATLAEIEGPIPAPRPGDMYYVEGEIARTRSWEPKRLQLGAAGAQTVRFTAGEINAWMNARFQPSSAASGGAEADVLIAPGVPNVAIADSETIYFNLPTKIAAYGMGGDFMITALCTLDASAGVQVKTMRISSAKVPLPRIIGAKIYDVIAQGYQATEDYQMITEAFARANSIKIEGSELVIELRQ